MLFLTAWCYAGDFADDILNMANKAEPRPVFKEDHVGFDLHADLFYYVDSRVDQEALKSYWVVKDISGREVRPSLYPFAVGAKSFTRFRPHWNRFDVRDDGHYQFVGLYSGNKGSFVVNKLRAHLLRELANSITHLLPVLDRTAAPDAAGFPQQVDRVKKDIVENVQHVFGRVDRTIRGSMKETDETSASANVVIITKEYLVVATMGTGRVLGHNSVSFIEDLNTPTKMTYPFGNLYEKKKPSLPQVDIIPRRSVDEEGDPKELQLFLIETPRAVLKLSIYNTFHAITQQFLIHRQKRFHEQEMFSSSVSRIMGLGWVIH